MKAREYISRILPCPRSLEVGVGTGRGGGGVSPYLHQPPGHDIPSPVPHMMSLIWLSDPERKSHINYYDFWVEACK